MAIDVELDSTCFDRALYDPALMRLALFFDNRGHYYYFAVPYDVFVGLISADSAGKYFNDYIRGFYLYARFSIYSDQY